MNSDKSIYRYRLAQDEISMKIISLMIKSPQTFGFHELFLNYSGVVVVVIVIMIVW